jgi:beta-lactamase superfamily II metal-dependent hydrolase
MLIDIHDVGHGACSVITSSDGRKIMIDCGYRLDPNFFPSIHYMFQELEVLALQNLDTDHLDDLPDLVKNVRIKAIRSNPTVTADAFLRMKQEGGMNEPLAIAHRILSLAGPTWGSTPSFPDLWGCSFWNPYGLPFTDTNNLSLPIFIGSNGFSILFGGDLEEDGWRQLLLNPEFRRLLLNVNILVASHHGRDNGCCEELFDYCYPDVVIFSDYEHRYETQKTTGWYANRVRGILDKTDPTYWFGGNPLRKVLTTRSDGSLKIDVQPDGRYTIYGATAAQSALNQATLGTFKGLFGSAGR